MMYRICDSCNEKYNLLRLNKDFQNKIEKINIYIEQQENEFQSVYKQCELKS